MFGYYKWIVDYSQRDPRDPIVFICTCVGYYCCFENVSSCVILSEKATDGNLPSEDWAANIEICDIINETDEG